jgi:hypothetical protein
MAFTTWTNTNIYIQPNEGCGCEGPCNCSDSTTCGGCESGCDECKKDCGCCREGLVEILDGSGRSVGCLTPNDAQGYVLNIVEPPAGYVKLSKAGIFYGFVSPADWIIMYPLLP